MLSLNVLRKKLSLDGFRQLWEDFKKLSLPRQRELMTHAVIAVLLVAVLVMMLASLGYQPTPRAEPLDRLGLLIELVR